MAKNDKTQNVSKMTKMTKCDKVKGVKRCARLCARLCMSNVRLCAMNRVAKKLQETKGKQLRRTINCEK